MRRFALSFALVLTSSLATGAANASITCEISGNAGQFQLRRIDVDQKRHHSMSLRLTPPTLRVTNGKQGHTFGGVWLVKADRSQTNYIFYNVPASASPNEVNVTISGSGRIQQPSSSSNLLLDSAAGAYLVGPYVYPGTYYLIGFGNGAGSWSATLDDGDDLACQEVETQADFFDFDASDFEGGTQLMGPGVGYMSGASLSFSHSRNYQVGGLFAYQPPPFPATTVRVTTEFGVSAYSQVIRSMNGTANNYEYLATQQGKANGLAIQNLAIDLPGFG